MKTSSSTGGDFRGQVLTAVDIVDLIGRTVALKRRGRNYVGLCPFHQEKTGSFNVNPEKQFFHCFGCKASGNAIDFVMKRDRVEFVDALRALGESVGLEMPRSGFSKEKAGERQGLLEAQSAACSFFEKNLAHPELGAAGRAYLEKRGISRESVQRFQIGVALDAWDGLLRGPAGRKFPPQLLVTAGLAKARDNGNGFYDTFRNRLMFPIRDENARVIAFGGRVMPGSQDPAKYLNSPETPLFSKSRSIFGIDLARQRIVETRTAIVVEGYTDVVMAHQYGVSNVVSILGTAMTEQHVAVLRRFADKIVLLFDADVAGDAAVDRAVSLFLTQPVEIAIASMPPDVDPDEFLLKDGAEGFQKLLAAAPDALAYKWKQLARQFEEGDDLTGRQKAVEGYLETLSSARGTGPVDSLRWGMALSRVSRLTGIAENELNRRFKSVKTPPRKNGPQAPVTTAGGPAGPMNTAPPASPRALNARDRAERWILGILLVEPGRWVKVQRSVGVDDFTDPTRRRLAEIYWDHQRDEGEPVFNEFLGLLSPPPLVELAIEVFEEVEQLSDLETTANEAVAHLEQARGSREQQKLVADLRRTSVEGMASEDEVALLKQLQERARRPDLRRT